MAGMELIEAGVREQVGDSPHSTTGKAPSVNRDSPLDISHEIDAFLRLLAGWVLEDGLKNTGSEET